MTPEFGDAGGGIGTSLETLARGLADRGHRVTVVSRKPTNGGGDGDQTANLRTIQIPCAPGHLSRWAFRFLADARACSQRPDVVHAPEWGGAAVVLAVACRTPLVTRLDTPSYLVRQLSGISQPSRRQALVEGAEEIQARRSRLILPASTAIGIEVGARWRLAVDNFRLMRNPVDRAGLLAKAAANHGHEVSGVFYAGRLEERKGLDILLPLIQMVLRETTFPVTLVGAIPKDASEVRSNLQLLVKAFSGRLAVHGQLTHNQTISLMASADVALVPSAWENAPLVLAEAMSLGRTVLAANVGGIPELVDDGSTGVLVDGRTAGAWRSALLTLLSSSTLRDALGRGAVAKSLDWDITSIASVAERAYAEAAG